MQLFTFPLLTLLFCSFTLSAAFSYAAPSAGAPLKLVLNWKPEAEFGGFYAAQNEGEFTKKGLQVSIEPGGSGSPTIQMVAAGKSQFGIVTGEEVVISRARGTDVVALFAVYQFSPFIFMTHAERNFKSIQDIFESPGVLAARSGMAYFAYLEKKLGKPKVKVVPETGGVGNFLMDPLYSTQGYLSSEPFAAAKKGAKVKNFLISDEGFNPYVTVLVARQSFVDNNLETVKSFVSAVREGWRHYLDHPEKTNLLLHELNPAMDLETLNQSALAERSLIETPETKKEGLGFMTAGRWKVLSNQLKTIGFIKREPVISELFRNY